MTESQPSPREHRRPPAAAILAIPLVVAVILTLFAWPSSRMEPRDLPIGVAGPPAAANQIDAAPVRPRRGVRRPSLRHRGRRPRRDRGS